MRAVITRVSWARVSVSGEVVGEIGRGVCALIGVGREDTEKDAVWLADKICQCRFFKDEAGKMNRSLLDLVAADAAGQADARHGAEQAGPALLAISQFTLYGDLRRGHRPSFGAALEPALAEALFERVCVQARALGIRVETGRFGANMQVESLNDGPVTLLLDSHKTF
jgi:D-tyrosyl-tRNA(Tyr) deacylase